MFHALNTAILGASISLAASTAAFACGGSCGPQASCAVQAPSCAAPAPVPAATSANIHPGHDDATQPPVPPMASGRQTYRSYSYDPAQSVYSAPAMRRSAPPAYSRQFGADRKFRGTVN